MSKTSDDAMSTDLTGKTVLVTGGASGIGRAAVELFAASGARVALNHLPGDSGAPNVIRKIRASGAEVVAVAGDVSKPDLAEAMVGEAIELLGGLDILINNAGTANTVEPVPMSDLDAMDEDFWQTILSTNLLGPFRCARAAADALRSRKGAIVNTASVAGLGIRGSSIAYGASKAGLVNLTQNLARALAPDVRVNAVAPGLVRTPWTEPWSDERKQRSIQNSLMKRMVEPLEIASAMLFLAVHPMVNAQTLVVDGGRESG